MAFHHQSSSLGGPSIQISAGTPHHRRLNSVKAAQQDTLPPSSFATPTRTMARVPELEKLASWKYPSSSNHSAASDDSAQSSCTNSTASSPSTSPDMAATYGWPKQTSHDTTGSPPSATRVANHRFSPSLPYSPAQAHPPQSISSRGRTLSKRQTTLTHAVRIVINALRRLRPVEFGYALLLAASLIVFASALAGIGYVPPPAMVAMPLSTTAPQRHYLPPPVVVDPIVQPEVQPEPEKPVVVEPVAPVAALPPLEFKQGVKPLREVGQATPLTILDDDTDEQVELPAWARHAPAPIAAAEPPVAPAPQPEVDDLVRSSPQDPHLDDEHAAHVHHNDEENIWAKNEGQAPVQPDVISENSAEEQAAVRMIKRAVRRR